MSFIQHKALHVHPAGSLKGTVNPPASKSYSARAVLAAALAPGRSEIENIATSQNVRAMIDSCRALGAGIDYPAPDRLVVTGSGRQRDGVTVNPGNSGVVLRLLLGATAVLRRTTFMTPFSASLGRRSNSEMVDALRALGVEVTTEAEGRLPITLDGTRVHGGDVSVDSRRSSQFLSGLLFLGGLLDEPLTVRVPDELKASAPVHTTLDVLRRTGVEVTHADDFMSFHVPAGSRFEPARHSVGSDPASTAALLALASAVDSTVDIDHLGLEELDGVLEYLDDMGVSVDVGERGVRVRGGGDLRAVDFDGSKAPDAVLPLAALAAHADGTSRFHTIEHIRYKECDRISDFRRELERAGVRAEEKRDELIVHGSPEGVRGGVAVDSHYDHAVVMAMSLIGLRSREGLSVRDPQYVAQTFPDFFERLQRLGGHVTVLD
ncbi:3-phosphoshikimate 1-carboxyvinyltransferase [Streptomyces lincolnensis]|uniref:3-phosphoshikimate 1-carboxyvinyltransferase n=1 Tax=Streptomyces lincolnensis TaxID=1915 RepID=UPI001E307A7A|nr:3-phosphoshikimate 1-carboxyvinyltransferase [Streptomyces lincolnensis]MCD7445714.1 3-phosphoshikimate 1-carboxyvinyltransferase [Streptomyces lincolnensis]